MTELNGGRHTGRHTGRRLTVSQAAEALGVTVDAIRGRIKRGSIGQVREGGRVYIVLDDDQGATSTDQGSAQYAHQRDRRGTHDNIMASTDPRDELIATLKEQLEAERNAHAETRRIAYALAQRVPELKAAQEPRESPQTTGEDAEGSAEHHPATGGVQVGTKRRSWWRQFFGF